jgi:hypothetical protein
MMSESDTSIYQVWKEVAILAGYDTLVELCYETDVTSI